jgi:glycosyltransferase involved in cell wall biosynthesis
VGEVDLVHATNFVLPVVERVPGAVTVHDLSFYGDDSFPGAHRLRELVPWSVERAARVIVPTKAVAEQVRGRFGLSEERLVVTYEGVSAVFFAAAPLSDTALGRMGITRPFAVAAGTIEPRKNLPALLKAWELAADALKEWTLILAGPKGWGPQLTQRKNVIRLGFVGDETLPGLLAAAEIFCYPSLYEGFGLPPLEAMAAGTPCVVGDYPAAREVLGDAAELVDATDVEAIAEALAALAGDETRRRLAAMTGRAHAAGYTWERTAAATLDAYRQMLNE